MTGQDMDQDTGQIGQGENMGGGRPVGWLDDIWTFALILPCLAAFVPGLQDVVSRGFQIIGSDVPGWYLTALGASLAAAFGRAVIPGGLSGLVASKR